MPAGTITGAATSTAAFVGRAPSGPVGEPVTIFSWSDYWGLFGGLSADSAISYQVAGFFQNGGRAAVILRLSAGTGSSDGGSLPLDEAAYLGDPDEGTGIHALAPADFNILCIPPDIEGGDTPAAVYRAAAALCVARSAMLIIDPPAAWQERYDAGEIGAIGLDGLGAFGEEEARNCAIYFPRLLVADPLQGGAVRTFPNSGYVAGVWARTDVERGVWKAPAGQEAVIGGITGLAAEIGNEANALLNARGVNCLRVIGFEEPVIWGARTLRGDDALGDDYKYVPVRRLRFFLAESLARGIQWAAFRANDETLWSDLREQVTAFLDELWRAGALMGATSREAYFVQCDATTHSAEDMAAGRAKLLVGFAPLKPNEFQTLTIEHQTGQA
jgi:hypothetical protein